MLPEQQLLLKTEDNPVTTAGSIEVSHTLSMRAVDMKVEPRDDSEKFSSEADSCHPASSLKSLSDLTGAAVGLDPSVWKVVERAEVCPFKECAFTVSAAEGKEGANSDRGGKGIVGAVKGFDLGLVKQEKNRSRCRHFHTLCGCRHTRGAFKGLPFQVSGGFSVVPGGWFFISPPWWLIDRSTRIVFRFHPRVVWPWFCVSGGFSVVPGDDIVYPLPCDLPENSTNMIFNLEQHLRTCVFVRVFLP